MILLRNADVYAPEPLGVRHLLIAGERIVWLGKDLPSLPGALGVAEYDVGRRRLIPGFIDGHVHLTGGGGEAGLHTRVPALALSDLTRAGVTTAVGVLGADSAVSTASDDLGALHQALGWARPGDLLLLTVHADQQAALGLLEQIRRDGWEPGRPLPR